MKILSSLVLFLVFCDSLPRILGTQQADFPPRGWNSYDSFCWTISEDEFLQNAYLVATKLRPHGYEYVVVDYLWYRKKVQGANVDSLGYDVIDEWGRVIPDPGRWPSSGGGIGFSEVANKVHSMGLKFGIHVMRGISTQAVDANTPILDIRTGRAYEEAGRKWYAKDIGLEGMRCRWMHNGFMSVDTSLGAGRAFLRSLYHQYAAWGVDFVKNDCVFGDDLNLDEIKFVSKVLNNLRRPILYSLSPGTSATPSMANDVSGLVNMYRVTGDDWDTWGDVAAHFDVARDFAAAKMIGAHGLKGKSWPDLDMLPLGWLTDPDVEKREIELKSSVEKSGDEIDRLKEEVLEWKSKSEECEKEMQEWKKKISAATTNINKHNRQIKAKVAQIEQLNSQKQEILEKCELEHISIPTISDPMDIEATTPGPVFYFSTLSRSHQQSMTSSEREKHEAEFTNKIAALISEIERTAPNLKALDQYEALKEKERIILKEFEEARQAELKVATEFNNVKQTRYEKFMEAFTHISGMIDKIYKQLTKSNTHPLGGTAYLNLDNEDEPFLHGIKYTTMPPTKRFRDMEQLSGGEKTVAALALLFSIHSYKASPFFILDEVDAALDNLNVAKVAGFIRSKSCGGARINEDNEGGSGFQSIVISLKDNFYDKAEALVGVYRDSEKSCSRTLTFDLTKYRES